MKKQKMSWHSIKEPLGTFYGAAGHQFDPQDPAFQTFVAGAQPSPKRLEQLAELLTASGSAKFASLTLILH